MYLAEKAEPAPNGGAPVVLEGIVRKKCVAATYNRMAVILAPHVLFTKNDALYVGAVTLERDGQPPKELKLGLFKLDGLSHKEIGARLGVSHRTVERYIADAIAHCYDALSADVLGD